MDDKEKKPKGDHSQIEKVSLDAYAEKLKSIFGKGTLGIKDLPPIKQVSFWLAIALAVLILASTIVIYIDSTNNNPLLDPAWKERLAQCCNNDPVQALQIYRELQNMSLDRITRLFTLFVASTLLPLLTTILGYLFGSHQMENAKKEGD